MRLRGSHAVVTGGGTGIGAAIARALGAEGAKLTLIGRRREPLEAVSSDMNAFVAPADVTNPDEVQAAFSLARDALGPISILVNNAGTAESAPFGKVSVEAWRRMMAVNLDALLHCCQAALPDLLVSEAGRIVTVASTAGLKGYSYSAPYVAAKHGAIGLTRALATELGKTKVTVNAVCPGFTETDMLAGSVDKIRNLTGRKEEDIRSELARYNPQGRLVTPEEVANAVVWLCLAESGSINGQAIAVAGGEVM